MLSLIYCLGIGQVAEASKSKEERKKTPSCTLYFVRHGKTMLNTSDRAQGWIDAPLTPSGVEVAKSLGRGLTKVKFDAVYSSDSGRAIETTKRLLKNANQKALIKKLQQDARLREFNFGTYEGMMNEEMWLIAAENRKMTLEELKEKKGQDSLISTIQLLSNSLAELDQENEKKDQTFPAETFEKVESRLEKVLTKIVKQAQKNKQKNILIVSHGMSIATILHKIAPDVRLPDTGLKNASVSMVKVERGKCQVESVNDLSFIKKGEKLK
ncbi:hypothetical protein CBF30_04575 [Vagococcus entomophilus]|uniref:Histidine phosphatase family protein n=2 Tax=Vagococcus entomophilus TaxID=1160095 RepID=A0A430AL10_9ENTE|nr:hypothetical protein CBF30_04575 [Vagococcus entomophilus]